MRRGVCFRLQRLVPRTFVLAGGDCLPTITIDGNNNRKGAFVKSGDGLATVVKTLPTLLEHDSKNDISPSRTNRDSPGLPYIIATLTAPDWKSCAKGHQGNSRPLSEQVPGPLNPSWCEWFMGWPIGSTELQHLGTVKSPFARQRRGGSSEARDV